jgi:malic enzyme
MGAAGVACVKLSQHAGVGHFIGVDRHGIVSPDRTDLNAENRSIPETTNPEGRHLSAIDRKLTADPRGATGDTGADVSCWPFS